MVLVPAGRTWTLSLCSICLLQNAIADNIGRNNKGNKDSFFRSDKVIQKNYHFEDFFWTGSGDGSLIDFFQNDTTTTDDATTAILQTSPFDTWRTTTVFHTTTILFATIYPDQLGCNDYDCLPQVPFSTVQTDSIDFSIMNTPSSTVPDVRPSSTLKLPRPTAAKPPDEFSNGTIVQTTTVSKGVPFSGHGSVHETNAATAAEERDLTTTVFPEILHDQKYLLLTILQNDNRLPNLEVNLTEAKLSNLYQQAFNRRRQEKYFGETDFRDWRDEKAIRDVKAHIVNVTQIGKDVGLVYSVTITGKPVPATTAANDMRLMTTSEVIAELGHPILTKAEPFAKAPVPLGARVKGRARDTWLLIGSVVAAIFLLMLLVGLFALILSKKQTEKNGGHVEEEKGTTNLGFEDAVEPKPESSVRQLSGNQRGGRCKFEFPVGGEQCKGGNTVKFKDERRGSSTSSICSGSSEAGLVRFRQQQTKRDRRRDEVRDKPKPKPRTRERRIQSSDLQNVDFAARSCALRADSAKSKNTLEDSVTEEYSPRQTRSPTSYLSMPSVKAFPRGTKIPEPLNKILEPTSIRHLDADSDSQKEYTRFQQNRHVDVEIEHVYEVKNEFVKGKAVTRHASLEGDDPGFIGPVVWNKNCQKIIDRDTGTPYEDEYDNLNVGRMRKRFNELLDDALSMFGSSNGSPEGSEIGPAHRQPDNRIHSAVLRPAELKIVQTTTCRPNTTGSKRPLSSTISGPKGAWETPSCSTLARPLSAAVVLHEASSSSPTIDKNLIYVNSELSPGDPAVPLIAAIKNELKKFDREQQ